MAVISKVFKTLALVSVPCKSFRAVICPPESRFNLLTAIMIPSKHMHFAQNVVEIVGASPGCVSAKGTCYSAQQRADYNVA